MYKKRLGIMAAAILLILLLAACGGGAEEVLEPEPEPTPEPIETPVVETPPPPPEPPEPTNPLTGELMDEELGNQRPWAVILDNVRKAMPHDGIRYADILYEVPVEGGFTRVLAVFQDIADVGEIGPVRSGRHYFLDLVQGHDAIFVHGGGSPQAYAAIRDRGISNIDGVNGSGNEFFRDPDRRRTAGLEHSLMTSSDLLLQFVGNYNFSTERTAGFTPGLMFAEDGRPADGQRADTVQVSFSIHKMNVFEFDPQTGLYRISQRDEQPLIDGVTEEQIQVVNVLVLFAGFSVMDDVGRLSVDFSAGGTGYYINGGQAVAIRWDKPVYGAPFIYTLEDGRPLELGIGKSYINIVNTTTGGVQFG